MTNADKITKAKELLGTKWVLHPRSTYQHLWRQVAGSVLMANLRAKAITEGRLA